MDEEKTNPAPKPEPTEPESPETHESLETEAAASNSEASESEASDSRASDGEPSAAEASEPSVTEPAASVPPVPEPPAPPPPPAVTTARTPNSSSLSSVTIPVLVSAIANILSAYFWLATCIGVFLTAPMLALCIFEFIFYAKAPQMTPQQIRERGTTLGIFQIVIGLFNLVSLVCGIILLVNLGRYRAGTVHDPALPRASEGT